MGQWLNGERQMVTADGLGPEDNVSWARFAGQGPWAKVCGKQARVGGRGSANWP